MRGYRTPARVQRTRDGTGDPRPHQLVGTQDPRIWAVSVLTGIEPAAAQDGGTVRVSSERFRLRIVRSSGPAPGQALASRSIIYTPGVANTPRTVDKGLTFYHTRLSWAIGLTLYPGEDHDALTGVGEANGPFAELLIVDEADRLKTPALEQLRDHHDRTGIGLILIGMPGIEKRLARYPQLYSRVGFVHHYRPLSAQEQALVLARHWPGLGLGDTSDFTTSEAVAAITRITSGNFRLTCRLVAQIQHVLDINHLSVVTREVVEAARESLVIGVM